MEKQNQEAGSLNHHVSKFWDFLPTVAELTELPLKFHTDGISFLPSLLNKPGQKEHEYLYREFHDQKGRGAVRKGKWKGMRDNVQLAPDSPLELYDLTEDPSEKNTITGEHPEQVQKLDIILKEFHESSSNHQYNFEKFKKTKEQKTRNN